MENQFDCLNLDQKIVYYVLLNKLHSLQYLILELEHHSIFAIVYMNLSLWVIKKKKKNHRFYVCFRKNIDEIYPQQPMSCEPKQILKKLRTKLRNFLNWPLWFENEIDTLELFYTSILFSFFFFSRFDCSLRTENKSLNALTLVATSFIFKSERLSIIGDDKNLPWNWKKNNQMRKLIFIIIVY